MTFDELLELQHRLQVESFGIDPLALEGDERIGYIKNNVLDLLDELHEVLDEVGWKFWASSRHVNEEAALAELVDALHFFANLVLAVVPRGSSSGDAGEALTTGYLTKRQVNADRQAAGYTGTDKCPTCKRDRATTARWNEGYDGEAGVVEPFQYCPCGFVYPNEAP